MVGRGAAELAVAPDAAHTCSSVHPVPLRRAGEPWRSAAIRCLTRSRSRRKVVSMEYREIITIEPGKRSGKPCIRGMRITVTDVLEYLASGMTEDEILEDFPELTRDD